MQDLSVVFCKHTIQCQSLSLIPVLFRNMLRYEKVRVTLSYLSPELLENVQNTIK